ncbi:MAG: 2-oxo acid dehydrogenase subunit E2 [Bacteroidota bacterium]
MPTSQDPTDPYRHDSPWRRVAAAVFAAPTDARLSVTVDVDVTEATRYLHQERAPGVRLGLVHLVAAAIARTIADDVPAMNTYLHRGRVRAKRSLTVLLTAKAPGRDALTEVRLPDAHLQAASDLAASARAAMQHLRTPEGKRALTKTYALAKVPWLLRRPTFKALRGLAMGAGLPLDAFDLAPESFGTVVLSEVGRFKHRAAPFWTRSVDGPLVPAAQGTTVVWLMEPRSMPVADGGEVVLRTCAPISATFDHRLVDGRHVGAFFSGVARRLQEPAQLNEAATGWVNAEMAARV